jgi:hypothetical protein
MRGRRCIKGLDIYIKKKKEEEEEEEVVGLIELVIGSRHERLS